MFIWAWAREDFISDGDYFLLLLLNVERKGSNWEFVVVDFLRFWCRELRFKNEDVEGNCYR